jgi:hemerythrin
MMQRIEWNRALELGHPEIDAQHRRMVEIFNLLHDAVYAHQVTLREDLLLDELVRVADENFRTEEALMEGHSEPALQFDAHREAHVILLHELVALRDGLFARHAHVNLRALNFLKKWLFGHMSQADRDLLHITRAAATARSAA